MYAVPGQHDLPYHRLSDIHKSSFWTLVEAGKVTMLNWENPICLDGWHPMRLHGFPWGVKPRSLKQPHDLMIEVAIIHRMIWTRKTGYPGAPEDRRLHNYEKRLRGYDIAVFGDNHITTVHNLDRRKPGPAIFNPGGFMRRTVAQLEHRPCVGLLCTDGTVGRYYLNCSRDQFLVSKTATGLPESLLGDLSDFVDELNALGGTVTDFREAIHRYLDAKRVPKSIRKVILQALEGKF